MHGLVGEQRRSGDVAHRQDVGHVGAHLPVDRNVAALGDSYAGRLGTDRPAIREAADRDQYALEQLWRDGLFAREADAQPGSLRRNASHLSAEQDLLIARADAPLERTQQVRIGPRHQRAGELDETHRSTERIEDARHLESDDAAADDQHWTRERRHFECIRGIDDARVLRQTRQAHGFRARGDDALLEADAFDAARAFDLEHVGTGEASDAAHHLDLALPGEHREPPGQLRDHGSLPVSQPRAIYLWRAEGDPARAHLLGILDDLGRVQQRLGGNATDVQAHPAQRRVTLDECHLETEIRRAESGGVAPRPRTEHEQLRAARGIRRPLPRRTRQR